MPWFEYEGLTPGGTGIAGRIEAIDPERAKQELAQMQVDVRDIREARRERVRFSGLTEDDLVFFNQQLASLAEAGIALDEGLAQLARDLGSSKLRSWIEAIVEDLRRGVPIDEAIQRREAGLPLLYSRVIRAGIESGELPATLLNLNQHLRMAGSTRRMLWEIISYPLIIVVLAIGIGSFFYGFMVPHFEDIFKDFGTHLPTMTRAAIAIGQHYGLILGVMFAILVGAALIWRSLRLWSGGRAIRERIVLSVPAVGQVYRASLVARFLRAVSTSVATGIPLPQAMRLGSGATGSTLLIHDAERLADEVEQGRSIFVAAQSTHIIPPLFGFCVQVASGRDALPLAISQLARSYEHRAVHTQALLRVILFPLLIALVGAFLAFGVVAMFLPLVTMINSVSGW
ncbi:MAG TPA: type II secretion system F family protein [Phycisphaerae bacterium]|nr:type II secretion system F family protein [Phycisphaerae bacterium]HOM53640.1 type II secretion system F family protein [Phycisphaerae bacterium]